MKPKLLFFDMEGVLVQGKNIWERMHDKFGTHKEDDIYIKQFFANEFGYAEWVQKVAQLWKGGDVNILYDLINNITYSKGTKKLFDYIHKMDIKSYILSTAIDQLVKKVANDLGINSYMATELAEENGKLTGDTKLGCSFYTKGKIRAEIAQKEQVPLKNTVAIGDAINDVSMFKVAGISIAFNSTCDELKSIATHVVDSDDLSDVLDILKKYIELI